MTDIECPTCHGKGTILKPGSLTDREEEVYRSRFGVDGQVQRTYKQVGALFGFTPSRAREIVQKAERKLRHPAEVREWRIAHGYPVEPVETV